MKSYKIIKSPVSEILESENSLDLFNQYASEVKGSLIPKASPDHKLYYQLEDMGMLDSVVVYDGEELVGFMVIMTTIIPHYSTLSTTIESMFVLKEHRKYGTGNRMIKLATEIAKEKGSQTMFMSALIGSDLEKVASSFGFSPTNVTYTKDIR